MKQKNAIFLADTRPEMLGTMLMQIKMTNLNLFDKAIIYYDKLTQQQKKIMNDIIPCEFVKYNDNQIPTKLFNENYNFKRFTNFMFARYNMFQYLDEYENVIWMDTDIAIQGSLEELIKKAKKTGIAMLREDETNKSSLKTDINRTNFIVDIPNYDMNTYLYCSGIIVINKKLKNYSKLKDYLYKKTIEYADYLNLPDQGALNLMIQDFKMNVTPIGDNGKYGVYPLVGKDCSKAIVIHSWGKNKFWNSWYLYNKYPAWKNAYQEWINVGGTKLKKEIAPDISIVIPVYKPKLEYFETQLNSILNQTMNHYEAFTNYEIIIVSEPEESNKLQDFIYKYNDPRINLIINNKRLGIAASINVGIKKSLGKYIARIDDDDICDEKRLFKQFQYLEMNKNIDMCITNYEYFGDMNSGRAMLEGEDSKAWSLLTCPFDHPTIMFRKEFFIKNNLFYDESRHFVEDWELWIRAFDKGMKVGCISEVLYYHRWYNGQAGQNQKTVTMMRDLVRTNFKKLSINLNEKELEIVSPWNGKVSHDDYVKLKKIFNTALKNNKQKKLYNQDSLEKVFNFRLAEAETGVLPYLVFDVKKDEMEKTSVVPTKKRNIIKHGIAKICWPVYKVYKNKHSQIVYENTKEIGNKVLNTYKRLDEVNDNFNNKINDINSKLDLLKEQFNQNKIHRRNDKYFQEQFEKLTETIETISKSFEIINQNANKLEEVIQKSTLISDKIYDLNQEYNLFNDFLWCNLKHEKKIFLIGTSEHSNIGDAAICLGAFEFIRRYFENRRIIEISTYEFENRYAYLSSLVNDDDLILLQGGGNLGNRYIVEENVRRKVIQDFPNNKIVILPQTFYFDETDDGNKELKISSEIYNRHKDLTIFARGHKSEEKMKENFKNSKVYNYIDIALILEKKYNYKRNGIFLCLRDLDDESGLIAEEAKNIIKTVEKYDINYEKSNNMYTNNIYKNVRDYVVNTELEKISKHKVIVTDRLHGLIFSIITKTPCVLISSYNYKISDFYRFVEDSNAIFFIDKDLDKLEDAIQKALLIENPIYPKINSNSFDKMYDEINWK